MLFANCEGAPPFSSSFLYSLAYHQLFFSLRSIFLQGQGDQSNRSQQEAHVCKGSLDTPLGPNKSRESGTTYESVRNDQLSLYLIHHRTAFRAQFKWHGLPPLAKPLDRNRLYKTITVLYYSGSESGAQSGYRVPSR